MSLKCFNCQEKGHLAKSYISASLEASSQNDSQRAYSKELTEDQFSEETAEESSEVQKDPWLLTVTVDDSNARVTWNSLC